MKFVIELIIWFFATLAVVSGMVWLYYRLTRKL
jgi:hypothetical protein